VQVRLLKSRIVWITPKFIKFWFPVILYSGIIFLVSSIPDVQTPLGGNYFDKVLHLVMYAPLGFFLTRAFLSVSLLASKGVVYSRMGISIAVAFCAFLYGISDEYHQSFVPGRSSTLWDVLADMLGGWLGAYIYFLCRTYKKWLRQGISAFLDVVRR
jgi:VanZ family protein